MSECAFGELGVPDTASHPNARTDVTVWSRAEGGMWLFGEGLWVYSPTTDAPAP